MDITFEWNDVSLSPEQVETIQENIRSEIGRSLPHGVSNVRVSLWGDPLMLELKGTAADDSGNALVSISYSLTSQHDRKYQPIQAKSPIP